MLMSLIAILDIVFVLASLRFLLLKSLEAEFFWTSFCDSVKWRRASVKSSMSNQLIATGTKEVNPHCPNSLECSRADTYLWVQLISPNFPQQQVAFKNSGLIFIAPKNDQCLLKRQTVSKLAQILTVTSKYILFHISGGCT